MSIAIAELEGGGWQVREYNIHKALSHPRVVALWDIFEIDGSSFATVLEVAAGGDLAWHLQQHKAPPTLPNTHTHTTTHAPGLCPTVLLFPTLDVCINQHSGRHRPHGWSQQ